MKQLKLTNLNIRFEDKLPQENWDKVMSPDYFELSKEGIVVIHEHRPYFILHRGRNIEKGLLNQSEFISTTYLLMPADLISDVPMIKTTSNFNCLHSVTEINEEYDKLIKSAEAEVQRLKNIKQSVLVRASKYNLPITNVTGLTRKTNYNDIKKEME